MHISIMIIECKNTFYKVIIMLEKLQLKNPDIKIYDVKSEEFAPFGRVVEGIDISEIVEEAEKIQNPESGSSYLPAVEAFEKLSIAGEIKTKLFGEGKIQVGYCWGHSNFLNATEWHTSSEVNIAITDIVLILGHIWDIKDETIDSSQFKVFYVPKGTVLEVYATSLHFCPCEVAESGFGCVVALPNGTNTPLDGEYEDTLLFRKNKWIISHVDNAELIAKGVKAGITGTNYKIDY